MNEIRTKSVYIISNMASAITTYDHINVYSLCTVSCTDVYFDKYAFAVCFHNDLHTYATGTGTKNRGVNGKNRLQQLF